MFLNQKSIEIDHVLQSKIDRVEALKGEVESYYSISPKQLIDVKKKYFTHALYHTYIEPQLKLSMNEVEELIFYDKVTGDYPLSDYIEFYKKSKALFYLEKEANQHKKLSIKMIQKLYYLLYWEEDLLEEEIFTLPYRDSISLIEDNSIDLSRTIFSDIPYQLEKLINETLDKRKEHSPLLLASQFQQFFMEISPFKKGNEEISFYLFQYIIMNEGYPPLIFYSNERSKYVKMLKLAAEHHYHPMFDFILDQGIYSLEHLLILLKQAKNKIAISPTGYFTSLVKEIQTTEREVSHFKVQKSVDEKAIRDLLTYIEALTSQYFIENPIVELTYSHHRVSLTKIMHAYLMKNYLIKHGINPLWKTINDEKHYYYADSVDSVLKIEFISEHLYIPNCVLYFGVIPTRQGNYLFSVQISTYLDFKREERYPNNLSFFRAEKGGITLVDWGEKAIGNFFNLTMKEFFEQLSEKVSERKRILKSQL